VVAAERATQQRGCGDSRNGTPGRQASAATAAAARTWTAAMRTRHRSRWQCWQWHARAAAVAAVPAAAAAAAAAAASLCRRRRVYKACSLGEEQAVRRCIRGRRRSVRTRSTQRCTSPRGREACRAMSMAPTPINSATARHASSRGHRSSGMAYLRRGAVVRTSAIRSSAAVTVSEDSGHVRRHMM